MLESVVSGLESCGPLKRIILPRPPRSRRKLHAAFWQHGASVFEAPATISSGRSGDMSPQSLPLSVATSQQGFGQQVDPQLFVPRPRLCRHGRIRGTDLVGDRWLSPSLELDALSTSSSRASAPIALESSSLFLLDFLYPRGTAPQFRKRHLVTDSAIGRPVRGESPRPFTSSVPRADFDKSPLDEHRGNEASVVARTLSSKNWDEFEDLGQRLDKKQAEKTDMFQLKRAEARMLKKWWLESLQTDDSTSPTATASEELEPSESKPAVDQEQPLFRRGSRMPPAIEAELWIRMAHQVRDPDSGQMVDPEEEPPPSATTTTTTRQQPPRAPWFEAAPVDATTGNYDVVVSGKEEKEEETSSWIPPFDTVDMSPADVCRKFFATESGSEEKKYCHWIWTWYEKLEEAEKSEFTSEVVKYLAWSDKLVRWEQAVSLFSRIDREKWGRNTVRAVIHAEVGRGQLERAIDIFEAAIKEKRYTVGLTEILVSAFEKRNWPMAAKAWMAYFPWKYRIFDNLGNALRAVNGLDGRVFEFEKYIDSLRIAKHIRMAPLLRLLELAARAAIHQPCRPENAQALLRIADKAEDYRKYMHSAAHAKTTTHFSELYRDYRKFPAAESVVYSRLFTDVFDALCPHDVEGLRFLWDDYNRDNEVLDSWGYSKYMAFYASRGDVERVQSLWSEWVSTRPRWKDANALEMPQAFSPLLNVHAQRGDVINTERVFSQIRIEYGIRPDAVLWTIVVRAYIQARMYTEAVAKFEELCRNVEPDRHSYEMAILAAGANGDLSYALELYRRVRSGRVAVTHWMISGLVEAYCHHQQLEHAEKVCDAAMTAVGPRSTRPWNLLLESHAAARDIGGCKRVLAHMSAHGVKWDEVTFAKLLRALVFCRQTAQAYHILRLGYREGAFTVTTEHFAIVMAGALRNGEIFMTRNLGTRHRRAGLQRSLATVVLTVESISRMVSDYWMRRYGVPYSDEADPELKKLLASSVRQSWEKASRAARPWVLYRRWFGSKIVTFFGQLVKAGKQDALRRAPYQMAARPNDESLFYISPGIISRTVFALARMRGLRSVDRLMEAYQSAIPEHPTNPKGIPLAVHGSLMLAAYYEGDLERVERTWRMVLANALKTRTKMVMVEEEEDDDVNSGVGVSDGADHSKDYSRINDGRATGLLFGEGVGRRGEDESETIRPTNRARRKKRTEQRVVLPRHQYALCPALKVMQSVHIGRGDPDALMATVCSVIDAGFHLDNRNWNVFVAGLVRLHRPSDALRYAERYLRGKPAQRGRRVPIPQRRWRMNPRALYATVHTTDLLVRALVELRMRAMWSVDVAEEFAQVKRECPRMVQECSWLLEGEETTMAETAAAGGEDIKGESGITAGSTSADEDGRPLPMVSSMIRDPHAKRRARHVVKVPVVRKLRGRDLIAWKRWGRNNGV